MSIKAAGIIPTAEHKGAKFYYFGHEKSSGKITAFLGKKDPGENNKMCAKREFQEESLGVIAPKEKVDKIFADYTSNFANGTLKRVENTKHKQVTYITKVTTDGNPLKKFQDKAHDKRLKSHSRELHKIIAMKSSTLKSLIDSKTNTYKGIQFRPDTWNTLCIARASGKI